MFLKACFFFFFLFFFFFFFLVWGGGWGGVVQGLHRPGKVMKNRIHSDIWMVDSISEERLT